MTRLFRGVFIVWVFLRFGLDVLLLGSFDQPWLKWFSRRFAWGGKLSAPRGQRIR